MLSQDVVPASEFCAHHHIDLSFIQLLQEYGLLETTVIEGDGFIPSRQLTQAEQWIRLHHDLQINIEGLDVVNNLLQKVYQLQTEVAQLKARLRLYEDSQ